MTTTERTFDWAPSEDPRNANYPIRALTSRSAAAEWTRDYRYHTVYGPVLNQKAEGACAGHGLMAAMMSNPVRMILPHPQQTAFGVYRAALHIDEFAGIEDEGTSLNAVCTVARDMGLIASWYWCQSVDEIIDTLLNVSSVFMGLVWPRSLLDAGPQGMSKVEGPLVGGHALLATGYAKHRVFSTYSGPVIRCRQSWGRGFGASGNIFIPEDGFRWLWDQQGEAAVISRQPKISLEA